jgi:2-oxoglutarate dehydrogenase E1 component
VSFGFSFDRGGCGGNNLASPSLSLTHAHTPSHPHSSTPTTEQGTPPEAIAEAYHAYEAGESAVAPLTAAALSAQTIHESMKLLLLVRAHQVNGHFMADTDPLGLDAARTTPPELDPATYGFTEADLDREFYLGTWRMAGFMSEDRPVRTLREVLGRLRDAYCGKIGYE